MHNHKNHKIKDISSVIIAFAEILSDSNDA